MASYDDRNQVQMQTYPPQPPPQQSLYVGQVVIPPQAYVNNAQPYAASGVMPAPAPQAYINNAQPYYVPQGQPVMYSAGGGGYYVPQQVG